MGQQPTKGTAPGFHRKQPAPFLTGAWEWWSTGYFDETPEENGLDLTVTAASGSRCNSWTGKIQGLQYEQLTEARRPEYLPGDSFKCPAMFFTGSNTEYMSYTGGDSDMTFMHDGTGGTVFIICDRSSRNSAVVWCNGGTTSTSHVGFVFQAVTENSSYRAGISNGAGGSWVILTGVNPDHELLDGGGYGLSFSTVDGLTAFETGGAFANSAQAQTPTGSNAQETGRLGRQGNAAAYWSGRVTDVVVWNRVLLAPERSRVLEWAKHRLKTNG